AHFELVERRAAVVVIENSKIESLDIGLDLARAIRRRAVGQCAGRYDDVILIRDGNIHAEQRPQHAQSQAPCEPMLATPVRCKAHLHFVLSVRTKGIKVDFLLDRAYSLVDIRAKSKSTCFP